MMDKNSNKQNINSGKYPILFLEPVLQHKIWGGTRLITDFGYHSESSDIGECWGIAAHPHGDVSIKGGRYDGEKLSDFWRKEPDFFGKYSNDRFPLLIKIIDAKEDLSIQVHPDDSYARTKEQESFGKMECWYILDCPEGANLVIGHNATTKQQLVQMISDGKWDDLIRRIPVHKGDFIQIDAGTVHSITAGCLILETQQNSDITYRLYDYDRCPDGKRRELHIDKSIDMIEAPAKSVANSVIKTETMPENRWNLLVSCEYYNVYKMELTQSFSFSHNESFLNMSVVEGAGTVEGIAVKKGDHFMIPAGYGNISMEGKMTIIASEAK